MLVKSLLALALAARSYAQAAAPLTPAADPPAVAPAAPAAPAVDAAVGEVGVSPSEPSGNTVAKPGDKLKIQWDAGATWGNMTVQLKTGANQAMVGLAVVAEGIDAAAARELEWAVPEVTPYSQIYFFEFTNNGPDTKPAIWTTRFTITSPEGTSEPPAETEKVGATMVGWGVGALGAGGATPAVPAAAAPASATPAGPQRQASPSADADPAADDSVNVAGASAEPSAAPSAAAGSASAAGAAKASGTPDAKPSTAPASAAGRAAPGLAAVLAAVAFFA